MKTTHPVHLLLPLILLSTAAFSLGAQTPYMDAMYIDVRWDRTCAWNIGCAFPPRPVRTVPM